MNPVLRDSDTAHLDILDIIGEVEALGRSAGQTSFFFLGF